MPDSIADAETVDGTAVEVYEPQSVTLFRTDDPVEIMRRTAEIAGALKDFVKSQGLTKRIGSNDYLLVDAWQMLGVMLNVTPAKVVTRPVENGWEATVELHDRAGRVVGSGEAECLVSESSWKNRDDFARRSMAQTRAVGKAYRNTFGFIAKAAGFEATPAEEMTGPDIVEDSAAPAQELLSDASVKEIVEAFKRAKPGIEPIREALIQVGAQSVPTGEQIMDGTVLISTLRQLSAEQAMKLVLWADSVNPVANPSAVVA